ncbi:hypothetical protein Tco_1321273 [Tanacetum coccineum]
MVEPKKPKKKKDQIEYDADVAQRLQAELDKEASLKEREVEVLEFAAKLQAERARIPASSTVRKVKNMDGYKNTQLKNRSFKEIQMLFEKEMKRVNIFVDMDAELVKGSETIESEVDRAVPELAAGSSKRDAEEELDKEKADEMSQDELQQYIMIIVPEQGMNVEALQTKYPIINWEIYTEGIRKYGRSSELKSYLRLFDSCRVLWCLVEKGIYFYIAGKEGGLDDCHKLKVGSCEFESTRHKLKLSLRWVRVNHKLTFKNFIVCIKDRDLMNELTRKEHYAFFRVFAEDYGTMGLRYGTPNLSAGATFVQYTCM